MDVLPKFVRAYNYTDQLKTGMAPSRVTESGVPALWKRVSSRRIRVAKVKFSVGYHVRISKENRNFANSGVQTFSTEIFRFTKVIEKRPQPVYEIEDLNKTPIEGQFYGDELTPVRFSKETTYKIDKILDKRVRRGIREYQVRWRDYTKDFASWITASSVKDI